MKTILASSSSGSLALASTLALVLSAPCSGQEWSRFRGPNGTGVSQAKSIPAHWSSSDFNWKLLLPGPGHSSPVLWDKKIFLTSGAAEGGNVLLLCVDATEGTLLWKKEFALPTQKLHQYNNPASCTPVVDKDHVYVCTTEPGHFRLWCVTQDGKPVWEKDLGPLTTQHGGGHSPMLYQDKIILANEQDGESFLIAADAKTGKTLWQIPRKSAPAAYGTPCVYEPAKGSAQLLFTSQAHGVYAVDPASGRVLWEFSKAFDKRSVSSPVVAGGLVFGSCGSGAGGNYVVAIRPPASPEAKPELAYEVRKSAPYVPTSVACGNLLFLWSDGGIVTCLEAASGTMHWQERVEGRYFSSPVCIDYRIFGVSTTGDVIVLEASDKFKVIAQNKLGETSHATPAVANGRLYLRTEKHLYSIGGSSS